MKRPILLSLVALLSALHGCRSAAPVGELPASDPERGAIEAVLDDFHLAASEADGARYFGHMSSDAVFLGTDATERWTRAEFRAYALPRFETGVGWTYVCVERHVVLGPDRRSSWFDERVVNQKYGECRGTGALRKVDGEWKVAQYNLTIPLPNAIAADVVEQIRVYLEVEGAADTR